MATPSTTAIGPVCIANRDAWYGDCIAAVTLSDGRILGLVKYQVPSGTILYEYFILQIIDDGYEVYTQDRVGDIMDPENPDWTPEAFQKAIEALAETMENGD